MDQEIAGRDIAPNRLPAEAYKTVFSDIHEPLDLREAKVEAGRCYFCHDAPCTIACPTGIDIPMFIRQILTGDPKGAAVTIFKQNILGGSCARDCPTEQLCEQACVREVADGKPVKIGLLQRFATDTLMDKGEMPFTRAPSTGKRVAVVGAGPAGLSCAHRLATHGHDVEIFEAREKGGGLNEYGIAAYKVPDNFAQREVDYILSVGGITVHYGVKIGADRPLTDLLASYDAVFVGLGMGGAKPLGLPGEELAGVHDAISYIEDLRQAEDLATLPVGRRVVVIGGGMTAIDIAVQIRRLGAEEVTIVYRRGPEEMKASDYECDLARTSGVSIRHWAKPVALEGEGGAVTAVTFERTAAGADGSAAGTGETFTLAADMVFKAIGQSFLADVLEGADVELDWGRIAADDDKATSCPRLYAGGDCVAGGLDLTVDAVADGRTAAESIHKLLSQGE